MWFFPQSELKGHSFFIKVIFFSAALHVFVLCALFLKDIFGSRSLLISGAGARVSFGGGRKAGQAVAVPLPAAPVVKATQSELPQSAAPETPKIEKIASEPQLESPKTTLKSKAQEVEPLKKLQKNKEQQKEKEAIVVPKFTELKKKYSTLKTEKVEKKVEEVKKETASIIPKEQPVASTLNQTSKNKQDKHDEVTPRKTDTSVHSGASSTSGSGALGHVHEGPAERIEFVVDEPASSGNVLVQEIEHHYRRPPGFDEHEEFTFTFEICNGRAIAISPRGSEPLVLYSAIKEAVLKAQFPARKYTEKIELLIKSKF